MSISLALAPCHPRRRQDQHHRHPGLRRLLRRGPCRLFGRRPRRGRRERRRRRRGPDRGRLGAGGRARPCPVSSSSTSSTASAPASTGPWPDFRSASAPASPPWSCPWARRAALPRHRRPPHRHRHHLRQRHAAARVRSPTISPTSSTRYASSWSRGSWSATTPSWSATSTARCRRPSELEATLAIGGGRRPRSSRSCAGRRSPVWASTDWPSLLAEIAPSPDARPPVKVRAGDTEQEVACDPCGPAAGPGVQDHLRPLRGQDLAAAGAVGDDPARHRPHQSPHPRRRRSSTSSSSCGARRPSRSDEAQAGDIVAVPKLSDTATGDTLAPKGTPVVVPAAGHRSRSPWPSPSAPSPRATRTSS